jgi:hypothetical protein
MAEARHNQVGAGPFVEPGGGRLTLEQKDRSLPKDGGARSIKGARTGDRTGSPSVQGDVGSALRSAYEQTVSENIPSEMLDLLGKLA